MSHMKDLDIRWHEDPDPAHYTEAEMAVIRRTYGPEGQDPVIAAARMEMARERLAPQTRPPASLHRTLGDLKREAARYAWKQAAFAGACAAAGAFGIWPVPLFSLAACGAILAAANGALWLHYRRSLRIYRRNPAAAYLAELRHAFGAGTWNGK